MPEYAFFRNIMRYLNKSERMYKKFLDYVRAQFSDLAFKEMGPKPKFSLNSRIH